MNLSVGIVGLPNAGKSTLFNALLKKQAALAANYPFATIEPNIGVVPVADPRLDRLVEIVQHDEGVNAPIVPATIKFVDIAGLVAGASKGEGLGNKFLAHIREVSVIVNVLRRFADPDVVHVAGDVDPERDRQIVETELIFADLATLEKQAEPRGVKERDAQARWEVIVRLKAGLDEGRPARDVVGDEKDRELVRDLQLLTMKPVIYVWNVSEDLVESAVRENTRDDVVVISAKMESELAALSPEEQKEYLSTVGLENSGLDRLTAAAYRKLGLISFLTMGEKEVRAWTITDGMAAPQAAGTIHTDFEKKFIKAEVVSYGVLDELGSKKAAREKGKLRLEGRDYIMHDGDVVEFKIGS